MSKTFWHKLTPLPRFPIESLWLPTPPAFLFCSPCRRCPHFLPVPHHCPKRRLRWTQASLRTTIQTQRRRFEGASEVPLPITRPKCVCLLPGTPWPFKQSLYRRCHAKWAPPHQNHRRVGQFLRTVGSPKTKPTVVEGAISLALEMQSYLNLHRQRSDTPAASVNNFTGPSPSQNEIFSDLIFTIKEEIKRVVDERSGLPQQGRSGERPTSSQSQQSESNNHTNQNQRRTWNQNQRNRTNSRDNIPNRGQLHDSQNRVSFNNSGNNSAKEGQHCHRKNHETKDCKACFKCGCVGHFRRDCRSRSQPLN